MELYKVLLCVEYSGFLRIAVIKNYMQSFKFVSVAIRLITLINLIARRLWCLDQFGRKLSVVS